MCCVIVKNASAEQPRTFAYAELGLPLELRWPFGAEPDVLLPKPIPDLAVRIIRLFDKLSLGFSTLI